jgi:hypothetical protein
MSLSNSEVITVSVRENEIRVWSAGEMVVTGDSQVLGDNPVKIPLRTAHT